MTGPSDNLPWSAWRAAAANSDVARRLTQLYRQLEERIAQRGPTCWISGRCCNFDAYGHRLYVTGLEIAWVLDRAAPPDAAHDGCPFQTGKLCGIHDIRPLGCRVFFCQEGTEDWQRDLYESFLGQVRALHDDMGIPYAYLEWRAGLKAAIDDQPPPPPTEGPASRASTCRSTQSARLSRS